MELRFGLPIRDSKSARDLNAKAAARLSLLTPFTELTGLYARRPRSVLLSNLKAGKASKEQ
jgi:hypothetical protein